MRRHQWRLAGSGEDTVFPVVRCPKCGAVAVVEGDRLFYKEKDLRARSPSEDCDEEIVRSVHDD